MPNYLDAADGLPSDNNLALQAAFNQLQHRRRAYGVRRAMDVLPVDLSLLNNELADLRCGMDGVLARISSLPATAASGLRAKANALLEVIDRLEPSPEIELARSLAADVLGCRA